MSNDKQVAVTGYIEKLPIMKIVEDEKVSNKFIQLYDAIHGCKLGEIIYHKEQFNFNRAIQESTELQQCSKLSLYGAFLDLAVSGLSLEKGSKPLAYLMSRNATVKKADGTIGYEKRAYLEVSPYGELVMRKRAGQVKDADNPVVVYDGDTIKVGLNDRGHRVVKEYEALIPRKLNASIIGGFVRIEKHTGEFENLWFDISDVGRLKRYSEKNNSKWEDATDEQGRKIQIGTENGKAKYKKVRVDGNANALYTSYNGQIDPGFFEAKMVKHAFRSYPKVRTGEFTHLQSNEDPDPKINYDMDDTNNHEVDPEIQTPEIVNEKEEEAFGQTPEAETKTKTVTIEDESF